MNGEMEIASRSLALQRSRRPEKLAHVLRRLREDRFLSPADAAERAGLGLLDVHYLECAGTLPEQDMGHFFALCTAYRMRPSAVLALAERLAE